MATQSAVFNLLSSECFLKRNLPKKCRHQVDECGAPLAALVPRAEPGGTGHWRHPWGGAAHNLQAFQLGLVPVSDS